LKVFLINLLQTPVSHVQILKVVRTLKVFFDKVETATPFLMAI